jgi:CheY-like chemotaxis protein
MSHEIRTPLSGMIGMLSLLEHEHDSVRQREHVQHLLESASALRMLIDEILDFSRIEAGKLTIMNQPFSPCGIIEDVAVMLAPSAHYKELEFILDIDPRIPHKVVGDPLRFRQVVINLLGNAIKFTTEGYVLLRAVYGDDEQEGRASMLFEVIDTGIGIDKENQQQVFESFTQLDSGTTKRFSGSGLGTTVSRELVQLMGGEIGLESEPGEGSRFWFTLEWQVETSARAPQQVFAGHSVLLLEQQENSRNSIRDMLERLGAEVTTVTDENALWGCVEQNKFDDILLCEDSSGFGWQELAQLLRQREWGGSVPKLGHITYVNGNSSTSLFDYRMSKPLTVGRLLSCQQGPEDMQDSSALARLGPYTILLVEDNAINAKVIMHLLQSAGHRVVHVQAGGEALEAMRNGGIDAALMDVRMPGMDGLTATRLRREEEQSSGEHIPIIALTANDSKEDREACLAAGMDDFLVKPVNAAQLATMLQRYCVGL